MAVTVRKATQRDLSDVFEIGYDYAYNDALVDLLPVNEEKTMHKLAALIAMGFAFVAEKDGEIIGACVLQPNQLWFSDAFFLEDLFLYVREEHRNSPAADALMKAVKKLAEETGAMVQMSIVNGEGLSRKAEYYKRKGFVYVGGIFVNVDYIKNGQE